MKYTIVLIMVLSLFAQCRHAQTVQPTGSYDTLGIHWSVVQGTNATYYFQDFSVQSGYATQYVNLHESAYTELNSRFNATLPQKLRFFVWKDATLAAQLLGRSLGFTDPYDCIIHVRPQQTIGHEMTHALSYWAWGRTPTGYNRFINEGVAVAFDLSNSDRIKLAKAAIAGQGIHSVTDLWYGSYYGAPEEIFYPVAGACMDFLYKQNQPALFDSLVKNQTFESAQNIYGTDRLNSLIAGFNSAIGL
jgi:hypothetical protein